jgi:adenylate kinase
MSRYLFRLWLSLVLFFAVHLATFANSCPSQMALMVRPKEERTIVLFGPPGVGKGTQALLLVQQLQLFHLSVGDILRVERDSGSELGRRADEYMSRGELVPDDIMDAVLGKFFRTVSPGAGALLDGTPRKFDQLDQMARILASAGRKYDIAFELVGDFDSSLERIQGRLICPKCQKSYHVLFLPPRQPETCDKCGVALMRRKDDNLATLKNRWDKFDIETRPIIKLFEKMGILYRLDGRLPAEQLNQQILDILWLTKITTKSK